MFWNCGRVSKQPGARRTPKLSVCPNMYICFGGGLDGIFIFGPFEVSKDHKIGRRSVNLGLPSQRLTQEYKMTFKTPLITVTKSYPTLTGTSQSLSTATQPYEKRFELPEKCSPSFNMFRMYHFNHFNSFHQFHLCTCHMVVRFSMRHWTMCRPHQRWGRFNLCIGCV